jgi:hypothetical protein
MTQWGRYAIIDATNESQSRGKILLLLDDERTAIEIASELRTCGLDVAIEIRTTVPARTRVAAAAPPRRVATITRLRTPVAGV